MRKWGYQSFLFVLLVACKFAQARVPLENLESFQGVCPVTTCEYSKDDPALLEEEITSKSIGDAQLPEAEEDFVCFEKNSLLQDLSDERIQRALIFSHLAYKLQKQRETSVELLEDFHLEGWSIVPFIGVTPFGGTDTAGFVAKKGHEIWISFHGVHSFGDAVTSACFWKESLQILGFEEGAAHAGFLRRYLTLQENLSNALTNLGVTAEDSFFMTGHSMGGALTNISALRLKERYPNNPVHLTTIAAPRVFDRIGANLLYEKLDSVLRFWRRLDPVAALAPQFLLKYFHVGDAYRLVDSYYMNILKNHSLSGFTEGTLHPVVNAT